ncbi:hypothetical protein BC938DRAFT_479810 [Jimgerdemannia flammicorona]|uniref:Uncharacterized protein n=1 Tax=Jimgerdemannia flammicorona TaxID=994334 RepID=A0A433QK31_9FUNG|nr:hypothetical protein BC938DRAFT_479810 [Jimgerdemannia flammicorona]
MRRHSRHDGDLDLDGERLVLGLLEQLGEASTTVQQELGGRVQVGSELGEGSNLTVLGKVQLQGTGDLLHGLGLGSRTDTGHRQTNIDGGTDTLEEQLGLQEDLTVGDGNNVGGNVRGHITTLGFDDGQGGQGATADGTFEKTRVQIEDITRVGLTTRRTTQQQRHLTVGDGLLGKIVEDNQGVLAVITEPLADGGTGEGSEVLKGGGLGGGGGDDDRVLQSIFWIMERCSISRL